FTDSRRLGLTPALTLGNLHTATPDVRDNHDMPGPTEPSDLHLTSPTISSAGRVACVACRSRRIRCSHEGLANESTALSPKVIACTECRRKKTTCAHRVLAGSENTASLLSSLSLESKDGSVSSSTGAQKKGTLLPDAGSSALRLPTGESRGGPPRGPLMSWRTEFVPRDSEDTLYLEEDPPTSDDENPSVGKQIDRLLDSITKQQKELRTVKQNRPMLYVYLGPGAGQADVEKPLRLQDMIRRQVDRNQSEFQQASCGSPTAATEQAVEGSQQEEKSKDTDNLFRLEINGEYGYDLVAGTAHRRHSHRK
ncbi:hypothetical protein LTR56_027653, partial [Elasticomyces elasticus]